MPKNDKKHSSKENKKTTSEKQNSAKKDVHEKPKPTSTDIEDIKQRVMKLQLVAQKLMECQRNKCKQEFLDSKAAMTKITDEIKEVTAQFLKNKIPAAEYKKQVNALKVKMATSAESLVLVKCTLKQCDECFHETIKEFKEFLKYMCDAKKDNQSCVFAEKLDPFMSKKKLTEDDVKELTNVILTLV